MKTTLPGKITGRTALALAGILLAAALAGCTGSAVTGGGTTAVTVTIGGAGSSAASAAVSSRSTPRPLAAAIPSTVTLIRFTISGAGIDNIVQTVPVTGATMTVTLQVPSGPGRTILVEALDSDGTPRYSGSTLVDASGFALAVTIDMAIDPANPALQSWGVVASTVTMAATLNRLAAGDGIVIAAGSMGEILSSTTGDSWTSLTPGNISGDITALALGNNTFLAMTSSFVATSAPGYWTNHFFGATSDNVANWTLRGSVPGIASPFSDIAFGAGTFVAVGGNNAFHSQDNGATWSPGTVSGVSFLSGVAYGNGRFVSVDAASDNVAVSANGSTWTTAAMGLTSAETLQSVGFGGGLFLVTTSTGDVYTSPDGVSWTKRTRFAELSGMDMSAIRTSYGAGAFLVVTGSPTQMFFSFDSGGSWTSIDPFGGSYSIEDVLYWNGAFIGVGGEFAYPAYGVVFRSGEL